MEIRDSVNAAFECFGAVSAWLNVREYLKDREVKGVVWSMTVFWIAWGVWNLWYYPSLNQWLSFYAGIFLCAGNIAWVYLVVKDKFNKSKISSEENEMDWYKKDDLTQDEIDYREGRFREI